MNQLNTVTLTGQIGSCGPVLNVSGRTVRRAVLDTVAVRQTCGAEIVEVTTPHIVFLMEGQHACADDIRELTKGERISVRGRLRAVKTSEGPFVEVLAETLSVPDQSGRGYVNAVELVGRVGAVNAEGLPKRLGFSVCTENAGKDASGGTVLEKVWHSVTASEGPSITEADLKAVERDAAVHVTGRLDVKEYRREDGSVKRDVSVIATRLRMIPEQKEA